MDLKAVGLIAIGACLFAVYNVLTKRMQTDEWKNRSSALVVFHQGGASVICLVAGILIGPDIHPGFWVAGLATGVLNIGIQFAKMRARALEDVSLVTPIDSTTPAIVILTSALILHESPPLLGWIGIWVMAFGTYTLNIEDVRKTLEDKTQAATTSWMKRTWLVYTAPFRALSKSRGVRWALFACGLSTIALVYDGLTARRAGILFGTGIIYATAAGGNLVIGSFRGEFKGVKPLDALKKMAPMAVFFAAGQIFTNYAYRLAIVPYVGTLKRLQIPLTIILAFLVIGEKKSFKGRLVGGTLMAIGAALIAWK